ncbi:hypothetical protein ACHAQJ_003992 [Trichoderma viride]
MQYLQFPSSTTLEMPLPEIISKICGFGNIFLPEVARLIQSHSQSHVLWRFCAVLQLVRELESAETKEAVIYPLPKVLSWSRGKLPQLIQDESLAGSFIRFTIDPRGIRSIERISHVPTSITAGEMAASSRVFVVEPVERLSAAEIELQLGMSRLLVPESLSLQISLWSTPTPPNLWEMPTNPLVPLHRLASISLDPNYCTGISFFLSLQCVMEIHGHSTRHAPTHLERFEYINTRYDGRIVWIYVPLTAQDAITAVGVRKNVTIAQPHYFTFYTKTGGEIVVGTPHRAGPPGRLVLYKLEKDARRHLNLIHSVPISGLMTFIATDADEHTETTDADIQPTIEALPRAFFSSASLEDILNVHVFTNEWKNLCRGVLIEYEDGSKRSLGQCRLDMDVVQSWHKPLSFFHVPGLYGRREGGSTVESKCVQVAFDSESDHVLEDGTLETNYYEMKGRINFWFTLNDTELQIVDF